MHTEYKSSTKLHLANTVNYMHTISLIENGKLEYFKGKKGIEIWRSIDFLRHSGEWDQAPMVKKSS